MAQKKRKQQAVPTEEQKALKRETLRKWHAANPEKRRENDRKQCGLRKDDEHERGEF